MTSEDSEPSTPNPFMCIESTRSPNHQQTQRVTVIGGAFSFDTIRSVCYQ